MHFMLGLIDSILLVLQNNWTEIIVALLVVFAVSSITENWARLFDYSLWISYDSNIFNSPVRPILALPATTECSFLRNILNVDHIDHLRLVQPNLVVDFLINTTSWTGCSRAEGKICHVNKSSGGCGRRDESEPVFDCKKLCWVNKRNCRLVSSSSAKSLTFKPRSVNSMKQAISFLSLFFLFPRVRFCESSFRVFRIVASPTVASECDRNTSSIKSAASESAIVNIWTLMMSEHNQMTWKHCPMDVKFDLSLSLDWQPISLFLA